MPFDMNQANLGSDDTATPTSVTTPEGSQADASSAVAPSPVGAAATTPAPTQPAQPTQPTKPEEKSQGFGTKMLHGILNALGGSEDISYERGPDGKMIVSAVKSGPGSQWKRIIAGALTGAAAGASVKPGPGNLGRAAGAGFGAGEQMAQGQDQQKYDRANTDYEAQERTTLRKAQTAHLNAETTQLAFQNARNKVTASFEDSNRENEFARSIQAGGGRSTDLGVAKNLDDVIKMHQDMPNLLKEQANGNIIGIPHTNDKGQVDGMHYALVTPEWKQSKLDEDQTFYKLAPPTKAGQKPTIEKQTVKAGTMSNGDFWNARMAAEKEIQGHYDTQYKQEQENSRNAMTAGATVQSAKIHAAGTVEAAKIAGESRENVANTNATAKATTANRANVRQHDKDYVLPAEGVEKSYQMMQHAYDEYKQAAAQGKELPSGAQSMLALSQHLSTTFGTVKGARVTKDMIQHHLGARSISDSAEVAVNKLTNGDVLSPAQWDAFHDLIGQSRKLSWETAVKEAHRKDGVPVNFLPDDLKDLDKSPEANAPRPRAKNAQTGEEMEYDGKAWVPVTKGK